MIEVFASGNRWTFHFICAAGRILYYTDRTWETDMDAATEAKRRRAAFFRQACEIDHRQGACI